MVSDEAAKFISEISGTAGVAAVPTTEKIDLVFRTPSKSARQRRGERFESESPDADPAFLRVDGARGPLFGSNQLVLKPIQVTLGRPPVSRGNIRQMPVVRLNLR